METETNEPLVSIITVNYNGRVHLKKLLPSLERCNYRNLEIIVVDNASTDDSLRYVRANFPEIIVIGNSKNQLFAAANNQGLAHARGEFCCLLNNDVEVDEDFVAPIIREFLRNNNLAACQPKILDMRRPERFEYAGAAGGFIDALGYPFLRGRVFFNVERDTGQYDRKVGLFWASGACLFLRKRAVLDVGGFDEAFQLHMEEIDLCWRLRLRGWEIICQPESKIWHLGGGTLAQAHPEKLYWNFRNNIFLLVKNLSPINLGLRLPPRLFLDFLAFVWELAQFRLNYALAILKAYGWLLGHIGQIRQKRVEVQRARQVKDSVLLKRAYPGTIVLEYFVFKRHNFNTLWRIKRLKKHMEYR